MLLSSLLRLRSSLVAQPVTSARAATTRKPLNSNARLFILCAQANGSTNQSQSNYGPAIEQSAETQTPSRLQQAPESRRQGEEAKEGVIGLSYAGRTPRESAFFIVGFDSPRSRVMQPASC